MYIDDKKVIKAYESFSGWYWFATEKAETQDSVIDGKVYENDTIWFGYVQGFEEEWSCFSLYMKALEPFLGNHHGNGRRVE